MEEEDGCTLMVVVDDLSLCLSCGLTRAGATRR